MCIQETPISNSCNVQILFVQCAESIKLLNNTGQTEQLSVRGCHWRYQTIEIGFKRNSNNSDVLEILLFCGLKINLIDSR